MLLHTTGHVCVQSGSETYLRQSKQKCKNISCDKKPTAKKNALFHTIMSNASHLQRHCRLHQELKHNQKDVINKTEAEQKYRMYVR